MLLRKYGVDIMLSHEQLLSDLSNTLCDLDDYTIMLALSEVVATEGDLRARVNPKYRFDERKQDLAQCLLLDGYKIQDKNLTQTDPSIADAVPLEDDLTKELQNSGISHAEEILAKINDSSRAFRAIPPDYNASLVNARVALETLVRDIAVEVALERQTPSSEIPSKWGEMLTFLRNKCEITMEEEKGLAGVFGFLSLGAHQPVCIPEDQMTRLGRSFAFNMCWFLLKKHLIRTQKL